MEKGLVHLYCGDGKGKTTAAVGLAVRCAGAGGRVLFYQFLKDGSSSEIAVLDGIEGITVLRGMQGIKFSFNMTDDEKKQAAEYYGNVLTVLAENVKSCDMLVLDEVCAAVGLGFADKTAVLGLIKNRPPHTEIVLTGRNPCDELTAAADYITEMKKIRHPFDKGVCARKMIEY